nr:NADH-quinone oxidoreductase subunit H [Candidatus Cloacimonadota bacterium]
SAVFILLPALGITSGFAGDIVCLIYLLNIPSISYIIGALASGNPLANVGASREMKLILSYEVPFLLVLLSIVIKADMSIKLSEIIASQMAGGAFIGSISGVLGFIVVMMCIQAKLALVPFDMPEGEGEICDGITIEYSGTPYAMIILTKYIMLFILPAFVISLLMSGFSFSGIHILWSVLKLVLILLLITLIRNTNPRVKIHQAMRFFWIWMNLFAVIAVVLAYFGL